MWCYSIEHKEIIDKRKLGMLVDVGKCSNKKSISFFDILEDLKYCKKWWNDLLNQKGKKCCSDEKNPFYFTKR